MQLKIVRVEHSNDGHFGVLLLDGKCFCVTLELPWYDLDHDGISDANISCIPAGSYEMALLPHKTMGIKWEVLHVPGRTAILIHSGNTVHDSLGCILIGQYFDKLRGNRAILNSGVTYDRFMNITRNQNSLSLEIVEV